MSVTLSAAQIATVTLGGATVETDAQAAATAMTVDFGGPLLRITLAKGTTTGQNFTSGTQALIVLTVDLTTGVWSSSNGPSGTLSGAALTNMQTTVKGWRNSIETFTVNNNITPGSQVPWT